MLKIVMFNWGTFLIGISINDDAIELFLGILAITYSRR